MPPAKRRPDTFWLPTVVPTVQSLLDHGEATRGMTVKTWGGHLVLGRVDADGPDPRFWCCPAPTDGSVREDQAAALGR